MLFLQEAGELFSTVWDGFVFLGFPLAAFGSRELQTTKFKNFWGKFGTKLQEQEAK